MNPVIDAELLIFCRRIARKMAKRFGLHYRGLHAINPRRNDFKIHRGSTNEDDNKKLYIELALKTNSGGYYPLTHLLETICHELAHVATWKQKAHHSKEWRAWRNKLRKWIFRLT